MKLYPETSQHSLLVTPKQYALARTGSQSSVKPNEAQKQSDFSKIFNAIQVDSRQEKGAEVQNETLRLNPVTIRHSKKTSGTEVEEANKLYFHKLLPNGLSKVESLIQKQQGAGLPVSESHTFTTQDSTLKYVATPINSVATISLNKSDEGTLKSLSVKGGKLYINATSDLDKALRAGTVPQGEPGIFVDTALETAGKPRLYTLNQYKRLPKEVKPSSIRYLPLNAEEATMHFGGIHGDSPLKFYMEPMMDIAMRISKKDLFSEYATPSMRRAGVDFYDSRATQTQKVPASETSSAPLNKTSTKVNKGFKQSEVVSPQIASKPRKPSVWSKFVSELKKQTNTRQSQGVLNSKQHSAAEPGFWEDFLRQINVKPKPKYATPLPEEQLTLKQKLKAFVQDFKQQANLDQGSKPYDRVEYNFNIANARVQAPKATKPDVKSSSLVPPSSSKVQPAVIGVSENKLDNLIELNFPAKAEEFRSVDVEVSPVPEPRPDLLRQPRQQKVIKQVAGTTTGSVTADRAISQVKAPVLESAFSFVPKRLGYEVLPRINGSSKAISIAQKPEYSFLAVSPQLSLTNLNAALATEKAPYNLVFSTSSLKVPEASPQRIKALELMNGIHRVDLPEVNTLQLQADFQKAKGLSEGVLPAETVVKEIEKTVTPAIEPKSFWQQLQHPQALASQAIRATVEIPAGANLLEATEILRAARSQAAENVVVEPVYQPPSSAPKVRRAASSDGNSVKQPSAEIPPSVSSSATSESVKQSKAKSTSIPPWLESLRAEQKASKNVVRTSEKVAKKQPLREFPAWVYSGKNQLLHSNENFLQGASRLLRENPGVALGSAFLTAGAATLASNVE